LFESTCGESGSSHLVDSGSSGSFLNKAILSRLHCVTQRTKPVTVKLANNATLQCDQSVLAFSWWLQGETFTTAMGVLPLGAYNAILGVDWLNQHGPISGDWIMKTLEVTNAGKRVLLQGVQSSDTAVLREVPVKQFAKWVKGNEIWACGSCAIRE
jgi:hypothetical protein